MTDGESLYIEEDEGIPEEDTQKNADRRRLATLLAITAVIVVVVLALLMLRGCGSLLSSANRNGSTKEIVPVEGLKPVDGSISVWTAAGTDLQAALTAARINDSRVVDMGGGRFIVSVPVGTEVDAVRMLKGGKGVYDAGRVYADEATSSP